jgi:hypothetical protein
MREFVLKDLFADPIPAKDEADNMCCENEDLKAWNRYKDNFIDDDDDEEVQANLVIRGLFICEFAYSRMKYWSKMSNFLSKFVFILVNSVCLV